MDGMPKTKSKSKCRQTNEFIVCTRSGILNSLLFINFIIWCMEILEILVCSDFNGGLGHWFGRCVSMSVLNL